MCSFPGGIIHRSSMGCSLQHLRGWKSIVFTACFTAVATTALFGQTNFNLLKSFDGPSGSQPYSKLIEGSDGLLYGTTFQGGTNASRGALFRMRKDGANFEVLRNFASGALGNRPAAGLIEATDGWLYGTTASGGTNGLTGTVFKLRKDGGDYAVIWHFTGTALDGRQPQTALIEGRDGFLYGTTFGAGTSVPGNVFKISKDGASFSALHYFQGTGDGSLPWSALLEGSDGVLYGTTYSGTTGSSIFGTIFKVNKDGSGYTVLRRCDFASGAYPYGGLIEGGDGALYGTTSAGGTGGGGTVFRIERSGAGYAPIFHFSTDGKEPRGTLVEGSNGALYGATFSGGSGTNGTVFSLDKLGGNYTVLHRFAGATNDGTSPSAGILIASDGAVYGTTVFGGALDLGTVFRLSSSQPNLTALGIHQTSNGMLLSLSGGIPGEMYRIQARTNLNIPNGWSVIGSNSAALDGTLTVLDSGSSNHPVRIYRSFFP